MALLEFKEIALHVDKSPNNVCVHTVCVCVCVCILYMYIVHVCVCLCACMHGCVCFTKFTQKQRAYLVTQHSFVLYKTL